MAKVIDFAERENAAGGPSSPPILWRDARDAWQRPRTTFRIYVAFTQGTENRGDLLELKGGRFDNRTK